MRPSECPASSCSMRSLTLAAMTSFAVCGLGVEGREVTLAWVFMVSPFVGFGFCTSALKRGMQMPNASWRRRG